MSTGVVVSPEAEEQIKTIDRWWKDNRKTSPNLFIDELTDTVSILKAIPLIGHRFRHPEVKGVRRILLRATRYHVYYVTDLETVFILAVWSAVRGVGPDLKRLLH